MTPTHVPLTVWADEGQRVAPALADVAAAIVTGRSGEVAAAVALGIARACSGERRVAVADLVGGISSLSPLDDQPGLLECLRDGTPVSDIGQPLLDAPNVYILPSGRGPIAERWVFESARWDRLVAGFREVDALLLLVAPPGAPGLAVLVERVDGVVAVDLPPAVLRAWPLIATVDEPEQELPTLTSMPREQVAVPVAPVRRRVGRWIVAGLLAVIVAGYLLLPRYLDRRQPSCEAGRAGNVPASCVLDADTLSTAAAPAPQPPPVAEIEVSIGPLVNPGDSAIAQRFSVELVAANTPESANSRLTSRGDPYPVPTIAPVVLQPGTSPWYRALVGAFPTRGEAEAWLVRQRALGVIRPTIGRVLDAPFALLLEETTTDSARGSVESFSAQNVPAYALVQDDGRARVYVGAFETAGQALWYAAELRSVGFTPKLAYRSGRMF